MNISIDKSSWTKVKLGDVFTKKEENDKESASKRFDRFLKVEHLDKESIHIRRWASQENGEEINPTFYKIFRKGQILFPTRNPHLRRTALASFDGICGEKTLTLEPDSNLIHPKIAPFLFHCNSFYRHATNSIVGSTNPHVRWRDVADYEFLLPSLLEQARLAELLCAMDEVLLKETRVKAKLLLTMESKRREFFWPNEQSQLAKLGEVSQMFAGGTPKTSNNEYWEGGSIPWLSSGEVHKKRVNETDKHITSKGLTESSAKLVPVNSVLIALAGQGKTKGTVAINNIELCTNQSVASIIPTKNLVHPEYLYHNLDSRYIDFRHITGKDNSRTGLNLKILREFKIVLHSYENQIEIRREMNTLESLTHETHCKLTSSKSLLKSLINQVF